MITRFAALDDGPIDGCHCEDCEALRAEHEPAVT